MASPESIAHCRRHGYGIHLADAFDQMWEQTDREILGYLELQQGCQDPLGKPVEPPWDGSLKKRRYWKKVQEG
jgi:hypothetical protein